MSSSGFKKSGDSESNSTTRMFSSAVSNVPSDVSDMDALTGAYKKRGGRARPLSTQELDEKQRLDLATEIEGKIWLARNLEQEIRYKQGQLQEVKRTLLYNVQHVDKEIIEKGLSLAVDTDRIRNGRELHAKWIKEAEAEVIAEEKGKEEQQQPKKE